MRDKHNEFILALIKQTNRGEIIWKIVENRTELPHDEFYTSKIYKTKILEKNFRLYEYQYKHYTNEHEWIWNQRKRLEIIDESDEKIFEFEYDYSLNDLFDVVTIKTSGIEHIINDFLR